MPELLVSPVYEHAPITEAVIALSVSTAVSANQQEKVVQRLRKLYPRSDAMQKLTVKLDTTGGTADVDQSAQGFRLTSDEQTDVVLIQPNGVTISRLAPYLGWEAQRKRAELVWNEWVRSTTRHPISRIGVRYINRIDVPIDEAQKINIEDYILLYPNNPCLDGGPMLGHIIQLTQPTIMPKWTFSITSTIAPPPIPKHLSFLLDIDLFRTEDIPIKENDLWTVIDQARAIKNDIFERCITDKTRELIS